MCKTWNLVYSCEHTFQFRLSKCRATVYTQSRPGRPHRPACMGGAELVFKKAYPCGDCTVRGRQQELAEARDKLEQGSQEREEAEAKMLTEMFKVEKAFPIIERRKKPKPHENCGLRPTELPESLLKHEVLREDVVAKAVNEDWNAYYDEWSSGWATTSDRDSETLSWDSKEADATSSDTTWDPPIDDLALEKVDDSPWGVKWNWEDFSSDASTDNMADTRVPESIAEPGIQQEATDPAISSQSNDIMHSTVENLSPHNGISCVANHTNESSIQREATEPSTLNQNSNESLDVTRTTDSTNMACAIPYTIGDAKKRASCFERTNFETTLSTQQPTRYQENERFNTMPPHLRKRQVALHRRPSDPNLHQKFKCFQLQTVFVST